MKYILHLILLEREVERSLLKKRIDPGDYALAKQTLPLLIPLSQPIIFLEQKLPHKYSPSHLLLHPKLPMGLIWAHNIMTHLTRTSHTFL